jgi:nicotinamidase-related amidase
MFNKENNEKFEMRGQFKPENTALVLIDYQVGTLQLIRNVSSDVSLRNAVMLTKAAERLGMPVVFTTSQEDHIQGPLAPALQHASPDAYKARVKRVGIVNAWADPKFSGAVEATGRKNLVMGGVTTDICLIFPSISAVQIGYTVQAVLDASGSSHEIQEEMSRRRMEQAGVVLTTTNTAIAELVQDWSTPAGTELVKLLVSTAPMMQPAE